MRPRSYDRRASEIVTHREMDEKSVGEMPVRNPEVRQIATDFLSQFDKKGGETGTK